MIAAVQPRVTRNDQSQLSRISGLKEARKRAKRIPMKVEYIRNRFARNSRSDISTYAPGVPFLISIVMTGVYWC